MSPDSDDAACRRGGVHRQTDTQHSVSCFVWGRHRRTVLGSIIRCCNSRGGRRGVVCRADASGSYRSLPDRAEPEAPVVGGPGLGPGVVQPVAQAVLDGADDGLAFGLVEAGEQRVPEDVEPVAQA